MKGIKRRRLYWCCECLGGVYQYPALVVDKNAIRCADCQRSELTDKEYTELKQAQTGGFNKKVSPR